MVGVEYVLATLLAMFAWSIFQFAPHEYISQVFDKVVGKGVGNKLPNPADLEGTAYTDNRHRPRIRDQSVHVFVGNGEKVDEGFMHGKRTSARGVVRRMAYAIGGSAQRVCDFFASMTSARTLDAGMAANA